MNDNHRRAINSILRYVETRLIEGQLKLTNNKIRELQCITDDFTPHEKTTNLLKIESLLDEIKRVKNMFSLENEETSLKREVGAALIEAWVILEGLRPQSLRNYGELDKDEETRLSQCYESFFKIFKDPL
jgi:chaperonin cofactor prefoldin